ncbi:L7Ae/L30e/S12e/Gadd45 family ribosomal protein [Crassaminicella profunda]|uniref:L7Ae/L30e/S12e/Gadd45 family ribosomal protein n=1 Tax=Crassaminicella profunda TaxID=1286698 RepID=UPI001CA6E5C6|nr:ribosomal L7Ae/L30e/S12e/Gadd45 family protein [Crassaminicella profunda]QZY56794.1 ribosomal L7Ae/L30e/S12e/Gadd45 family protein [Crassaminicella profunda]
MENKVLSFLGLAQRSGNLVTGEDTCAAYVKKNAVKLVLIANDASDNTKKKFQDMADFRNIKCVIYGDRQKLSQAVGKPNRAVYGIKDTGLAKKISSLIEEVKDGSNNLGGERTCQK